MQPSNSSLVFYLQKKIEGKLATVETKRWREQQKVESKNTVKGLGLPGDKAAGKGTTKHLDCLMKDNLMQQETDPNNLI